MKYNIYNFVTSFYFVLGISLVITMIGLITWYEPLFAFGLIAFALESLYVLIHAWIINPICSYNTKIIRKGFRRPLLQIPFCLPRLLDTDKIYIAKTIIPNKSMFTGEGHINKLFGFSDNKLFEFDQVHNNSFRFGWKSKDDKAIEIYAYYYVNGKRYGKFIDNLLFGNSYILTIEKQSDAVVFKVYDTQNNNYVLKYYVDYKSERRFGYQLGIFYGGKPRAPHKIKFKMW